MDVAPRIQNSRLGIFLLCAGVAFFGIGEACVKTLAAEYDILQVVWARYVFHALVFLAIRSRMPTPEPAASSCAVGGSGSLFCAYSCCANVCTEARLTLRHLARLESIPEIILFLQPHLLNECWSS